MSVACFGGEPDNGGSSGLNIVPGNIQMDLSIFWNYPERDSWDNSNIDSGFTARLRSMENIQIGYNRVVVCTIVVCSMVSISDYYILDREHADFLREDGFFHSAVGEDETVHFVMGIHYYDHFFGVLGHNHSVVSYVYTEIFCRLFPRKTPYRRHHLNRYFKFLRLRFVRPELSAEGRTRLIRG